MCKSFKNPQADKPSVPNMATHQHFEAIDVFPTGYKKLPEVTKFDLSDLDHVVPGFHTTVCPVFPLSVDTNKDQLITSLKVGLQNVLRCIPLLGGTLQNDPQANRVYILRENHVPIELGVHYLDRDDSFPTYEKLAKDGFPPTFFALNATALTPPGSNVTGFRRDDGCPVAVFQANFIKGGLIMTVAVSHLGADAKSIDHTYTLWANSSRAAREGSEMPTFRPMLDRSYFNVTAKPSAAETESLKKNVKGFTYQEVREEVSHESLAEPKDLPETSLQVYHFTAHSSENLKHECWPKESGKYVSTYDCMAAATWRAMTKARLPYMKTLTSSSITTFSHAIDARGRFGSLVPNDYFGNAFIIGWAEPMEIEALLSERGLALAAQTIRKSILDFNASSIPDLLKVRRGIEGRQKMEFDWSPGNVVATSWTSMKALTGYDFGFGLPATIRTPVPPFEGILGVLPAASKVGESDGYDVYVVMEKQCQERLANDADYSAICQIRGGLAKSKMPPNSLRNLVT